MPQSRDGGRRHHHREQHRIGSLAWLRASVMGANDGILSIGALLVGLSGANLGRGDVLVAGFAGLVAGAGSMAMGEYVSVSAEKDTLVAEHALEARELLSDPEGETEELRAIWQKRGLPSQLANQVAEHLMAHDALGAHMRDELGYSDIAHPRPVLAAASSFISFAIGALIPMAAAAVATDASRGGAIAVMTIVALALLGSLAASLGGGPLVRGAARVSVGGLLALGLSYVTGSVVGGWG